MTTLVTMMLPDYHIEVGENPNVLRGMNEIGQVHARDGVLPAPFIRVTPNVQGHGETWYHPEAGVFVIQTDHRPVLLTSNQCSMCLLPHADSARMYLFGTWKDFEARAYMRYVRAQIEAVGLRPEPSET